MVLKKPIKMENTHRIDRLEILKQQQDLFALVNEVQPGYFREQTAALENYYGIYDRGKLVACCGERMKMEDFTEISAVVTQPDSRGKGYAKQLIKHTTYSVFQQNKIPYLHVLESNHNAIALYKKLGFKTRRKLPFSKLGTL
jgi:predicted GNAT family acetyltransferase